MTKVIVQIKSRFQDALRNTNRNASKKLSKTLDLSVKSEKDFIQGIIKGNHYWKYIDSGRGPGPSISNGGGKSNRSDADGSTKEDSKIKTAILAWIEAKGIRPRDPNMSINSLASAITWKIIRKGYDGNDVFTRVINEARADTNLFIPLSEAVAVNLLNIPDRL